MFHQNPPAERSAANKDSNGPGDRHSGGLHTKGLRTADAATLPSVSGQYDGLPPNVGMQMGLFAPKDVSASMPHKHDAHSFGLPSPSGQNPGYPASFDAKGGR